MAIIYPNLFSISRTWTPLPHMCRSQIAVMPGEACVTFYNTEPSSEEEERKDLARFAMSLPQSVHIILNSQNVIHLGRGGPK